ncbi:transposase [Planctobacterium marinum]|uniref:transposase n=1 Tax=Planctobacterium marinum TaxID=1631968 RepID=UPI00226D14CD|nr:transposase [Planctobacterium marinum]
MIIGFGPFLLSKGRGYIPRLKERDKTLISWLQPILAMWRYERSNGMTEGFHNKMEMLSRRAYGFRNFENYRLRVMTHCGWDGIINRVR